MKISDANSLAEKYKHLSSLKHCFNEIFFEKYKISTTITYKLTKIAGEYNVTCKINLELSVFRYAKSV